MSSSTTKGLEVFYNRLNATVADNADSTHRRNATKIKFLKKHTRQNKKSMPTLSKRAYNISRCI